MTKALLTSSAALFGLLGIACTFAPAELSRFLVLETPELLVQLLGAGWLGFAAINWMWRGNSIGGIYGRPLVIGNLTHAVVGSFALLDVVRERPTASALLLLLALYGASAVAFGLVLFRTPTPR